MIAKDLQPLSVVEDEGFRDFVKNLDPRFQIPTRKTLRNNLLPKLYEDVKGELKTQLQSVSSVALTTDMWTSSANMSFLAVTIHFWNSDCCQLVTKVLDCSNFIGSHTSSAINAAISDAIQSFEINGKVSNITADGAANMKKAIQDGGFNYLHCFGHAIDLVVKEAIR